MAVKRVPAPCRRQPPLLPEHLTTGTMLSCNALRRRHMWQTHGVGQGREGINAAWMKPAVRHKGLSEKRLKIGLHTGMVGREPLDSMVGISMGVMEIAGGRQNPGDTG